MTAKELDRHPDRTDNQREPEENIRNPAQKKTRGNTSFHIHGRRQHREARKRTVQPTINMEIGVNFIMVIIVLINYLQSSYVCNGQLFHLDEIQYMLLYF